MSHLVPTYSELRELFHRDEPAQWARKLNWKRSRSLPSWVMTSVAMLAALGLLFLIWFAASSHREAFTTSPYYDTRGPVPPWSEPTPLEDNLKR